MSITNVGINRNIVECKDTLIITPLKTYDPY